MTLLVYSLRVQGEGALECDNPKLLPFRLLMAHPLVDATLCGPEPSRESALDAALNYTHAADVILTILAAYPNPRAPLLDLAVSSSTCVQLLNYPILARSFLPQLAAMRPLKLFRQRYLNAGDFAGELVVDADDLLWSAVTDRIPDNFRLPIRPISPCEKPDDWPHRDGLRAAIRRGRRVERALWLLRHTSNSDLDAYDCGGYTVLMRAIVCGGTDYTDLILELLKRSPALDYALPAVDVHLTSQPGELATNKGSLLTAYELFLVHWKATGAQYINVFVAFEAAMTLANQRAASLAPVLANTLPFPIEILSLTSHYASISPTTNIP
jgi:hypothetical protein